MNHIFYGVNVFDRDVNSGTLERLSACMVYFIMPHHLKIKCCDIIKHTMHADYFCNVPLAKVAIKYSDSIKHMITLLVCHTPYAFNGDLSE